MPTVYLVELEPVETRYTAQWQKYLPEQMTQHGLNVEVIQGPLDAPRDTTPGAFLNFSGTNYWKSEQLKTISNLFADGKVKDGDYFLYTDAWNPTVLQLKYMAKLLNVDIKIGGLWHAGAYDPNDFLGRLIGHKEEWVRHAELSMFHAFTHNIFATQFHVDLFLESFPELTDHKKIQIAGWPMEYMPEVLGATNTTEKRNLVLFPHRIAPEKQVEIFKDLAKEFEGEAEFIVCQEQNLSKEQYHQLLAEAKVVFSANLQETLGISCYEGALMNASPFVPDRLSYTEMYPDRYKYNSEYTESWDSYLIHKDKLVAQLSSLLLDDNQTHIQELQSTLARFFSGKCIYNIIEDAQYGK